MAKGEARSSKRKFGGKSSPHGPTPRRGPPAIFVTCEAGREKKCQREALELINHYYYASRTSTTASDQEGNKSVEGGGYEASYAASSSKKASEEEQQCLSLEEELAMLRKGAAAEEVLSYEPNSKRQRAGASKTASASMKSPFSVYDTGTRGVVCILCTLPECEMVPYDDILAEIRAAKEKGDAKGKENVEAGSDDYSDKTGEKKDNVKMSEGKSNEITSTANATTNDAPLWDAVNTVKCILQDAKKSAKKGDNNGTNGNTNDEDEDSIKQEESEKKESSISKETMSSSPPGSRFILRILPMQATCYSSVEEIKAVSISLLKRCLPKFETILSKGDKEITFKLEIKRRLSSHLKSNDVIEAVTPLVLGGMEEVPGYKFKVNLSDPDFSVRVETCKGLCGISILPREDWYKNFNLAELTNPQ